MPLVRSARRNAAKNQIRFLHDRTAQRQVVLVDRLRGGQAAGGAAALGVVAVPLDVLVVVDGRAAELVAAARRQDVHHHAGAGRRRRVDAAQLQLGVLHGVAAEPDRVRRGVEERPGRRAFEGEDVREDHRALEVVGAAADAVVDVAGRHARGQVERVAEDAARRDRRRADQLAVEGDRGRRLAGLDHRRLAGHGDGLLHRAERQVEVDGEGGAGAHQDALAADDREARQLGGDHVGARRQVVQPVEAGPVGDRGHRRQQLGTGRGDADAGQDRARLVLHVAAQVAVTGLRLDRTRNQHQQQTQRTSGERRTTHLPTSLQCSRQPPTTTTAWGKEWRLRAGYCKPSVM